MTSGRPAPAPRLLAPRGAGEVVGSGFLPGMVGEFAPPPLRVEFSKCGPGDLRASYDFGPSMGPNSAKLGPWFYVCSMHRIGDQLSSRVCPGAICLAFWFGRDLFNGRVSNESKEIPMRFMGFRWGIMKFRGVPTRLLDTMHFNNTRWRGGGGIREVPEE